MVSKQRQQKCLIDLLQDKGDPGRRQRIQGAVQIAAITWEILPIFLEGSRPIVFELELRLWR